MKARDRRGGRGSRIGVDVGHPYHHTLNGLAGKVLNRAIPLASFKV